MAMISTARTKIKAEAGSDQKGYVKNRYIGFNIRQIQDVIDHSEKFNIERAILFLDFTKAFDSLEWSFMTECLRTKIKAEAGYPCFIPRKTLKGAETHPLFKIHPFISVYIVRIHLMNELFKTRNNHSYEYN
jgi:hypothetical protein